MKLHLAAYLVQVSDHLASPRLVFVVPLFRLVRDMCWCNLEQTATSSIQLPSSFARVKSQEYPKPPSILKKMPLQQQMISLVHSYKFPWCKYRWSDPCTWTGVKVILTFWYSSTSGVVIVWSSVTNLVKIIWRKWRYKLAYLVQVEVKKSGVNILV